MMSLKKTLIMSDCLVNQLIDHQKSKYLDKRDINDFFYIAGPYLINNNHWVAFIVDMIRYKIILLDPMLVSSPLVDKALQSSVKYYNSLTTFNTSLNQSNAIWKIHHVEHPIQTDHYNCGIFVIHFVKEYINSQQNIVFDSSATSLACDRQLISSAIVNYIIQPKK